MQACFCQQVAFLVAMTIVLSFDCAADLSFSAPSNGVYIGIYGSGMIEGSGSNSFRYNYSKSQPIAYDENLAIVAYCQTGYANLLIPADNALFLRFDLRDAKGRLVAKTAEGMRWGSKTTFPTNTASRKDRMIQLRATPAAEGSFSSSPILPSAEELFIVKKPGTYYLTVIARLGLQAGEEQRFSWSPIQFSPIVVTIVKPTVITKP